MIDLMSNALRMISAEAVLKAKSGHAGAPLGMADVATVLWSEFLKFDAEDPQWADRDRFVLSSGHASALLYGLLYLTGFHDASLADLKNFRQLHSKMAGHPEYGLLQGVEATTGPLGQGLAMAVGMAIAERRLQHRFGIQLVNHFTYVFAGDGCLMEGISEEAIALAGHLKLNKLIVFWDNNGVTIDGKTDIASSTCQRKRFEANSWDFLEIDGHDKKQIRHAVSEAQKNSRPTLIACKTIIGWGTSKAGTEEAHGALSSEEDIILLKNNLRWNAASFEVPQNILDNWRLVGKKGQKKNLAWQAQLDKNVFRETFKKTVIQDNIPTYTRDIYNICLDNLLKDNPVQISTRKASQKILEILVPLMPNIIGGSADLTASNLTKTPRSVNFTADNYDGNYINYGIREHAMGAIMNGIALHRGLIPYGGTFLAFMDYLKPALRLSALMKQHVIYIFTHDSIGVGEDGPTHQPIEQLASLRSVPNMTVLRPCDGIEAAESWQIALSHRTGPIALILSRQNLPFIRAESTENLTNKGAYIISSQKQFLATIIATGSEVSLAMQAQKELMNVSQIPINVVSMPSWELFSQQPADYQKSVLGKAPRVAVEAGSPFGWERYAQSIIGTNRFGLSAPANMVYEQLGITVAHIVTEIKNLIKKEKGLL